MKLESVEAHELWNQFKCQTDPLYKAKLQVNNTHKPAILKTALVFEMSHTDETINQLTGKDKDNSWKSWNAEARVNVISNVDCFNGSHKASNLPQVLYSDYS